MEFAYSWCFNRNWLFDKKEERIMRKRLCKLAVLTLMLSIFLPKKYAVAPFSKYFLFTPTSIVSTLKNEGYTCVAMHPYYETGWSRNLIYPKLGFDESYFQDDFPQEDIIRKYVSDRELYSKIIERFESRGRNEDLFLMSISMQNHGGYTTTYENFEEKYYKTGFADAIKLVLECMKN